jgi:hypothetical protein
MAGTRTEASPTEARKYSRPKSRFMMFQALSDRGCEVLRTVPTPRIISRLPPCLLHPVIVPTAKPGRKRARSNSRSAPSPASPSAPSASPPLALRRASLLWRPDPVRPSVCERNV